MLARYKMYRGARPPGDPLPTGVRQDSRWRTKHPLRPSEEIVAGFLEAPTPAGWRAFRTSYLDLLRRRFRENREPFNALAYAAEAGDVFIGCSCPTEKNPRVDRCHTWLALEFMKEFYPRLRVVFPPVA